MTPEFFKSIEGAVSVRDRDGLMILSDEALEAGEVEWACWLRFEAGYISSRGSPLPMPVGGYLCQHAHGYSPLGLTYYQPNLGQGLPWQWWGGLGGRWFVYSGAGEGYKSHPATEAEAAQARRACEAACALALERWVAR